MPKIKPIDLDAAAEAERFGALAIGRSSKNRNARLTEYGLTTAQLRVLRKSAENVVSVLKNVQQHKVQVGNATIELSEQDNKNIVTIESV